MNKSRKAYYDSLSDQALVELLVADHHEAVEYLFFHRCDAMFAHIAHSVFNNSEKKNDLISSFYLFLHENDWEKLRTFEFRSSLNTWLTVLSVRFFKKIKISQTKMIPVDTQFIVETQSNKSDDFDILKEMSRLELYKAINGLSKPRERYALLRELSGMRAEEIAEEMGCTVSAVYNLTKKARLELKETMKENVS